jgi:hypothetical protein
MPVLRVIAEIAGDAGLVAIKPPTSETRLDEHL